MDIFWNILQITMPALLVSLTAYYAIKLTYEKELKETSVGLETFY